MNLRTLQLLLLIAAIAVFAIVNWSAFTSPTALSLVFGTVQAPLGLIMLALTGLLAALFLVYIVYLQAGAIGEAHRASRDMAAQRALADQAEASRFTALQTFLAAELKLLHDRVGGAQIETSRRIEAAEHALLSRLTDVSNGLAAHLGEVEDKIDRAVASRN
jgi:uncharacterized integral membrane protein